MQDFFRMPYQRNILCLDHGSFEKYSFLEIPKDYQFVIVDEFNLDIILFNKISDYGIDFSNINKGLMTGIKGTIRSWSTLFTCDLDYDERLKIIRPYCIDDYKKDLTNIRDFDNFAVRGYRLLSTKQLVYESYSKIFWISQFDFEKAQKINL